jgi:hypothetical protein
VFCLGFRVEYHHSALFADSCLLFTTSSGFLWVVVRGIEAYMKKLRTALAGDLRFRAMDSRSLRLCLHLHIAYHCNSTTPPQVHNTFGPPNQCWSAFFSNIVLSPSCSGCALMSQFNLRHGISRMFGFFLEATLTNSGYDCLDDHAESFGARYSMHLSYCITMFFIFWRT